MKNIRLYFIAGLTFVLCGLALPTRASISMEPQYGTTDDTSGRTYTGYYIEDGKIRNTMIVIKLRNLRSYWDGTAWVSCTTRVVKNNLAKELKGDEPAEIKMLAEMPFYVTINKNRVYFNPEEKL